MNIPEITAAKMICKSVDALTREVYLLRKDILEGWKLNAEIEELDKEPKQIPPSIRPPVLTFLYWMRVKHFQL